VYALVFSVSNTKDHILCTCIIYVKNNTPSQIL
jgi:hypothetical protein